jgi:Ca2+-binding EF-hand superfamily protein
MKRAIMLAAILGFASIPLAAQAPDEPEAPPPRERRGQRGDRAAMGEVTRILREHDKNQDGKLDKDELGDVDLVKKLDKNEDGALDGREIMADRESVRAAIQKKIKAQWEEEFKILDKDDSGKLTAEELGDTHAALLKSGDKDEDKALSKDEFLAAREAAAQARRTGVQVQSADDWLKQFDKDKDGKVSKAEYPERMARMFDAYDADKDGFVTKEEYHGYLAGVLRLPPEETIKHFDKNNDGKISKEEASGAIEQGFDRIDSDNDGQLTKDEIEKARENMRGRMRGPNRERGDTPPRRPEGEREEKKEDKKEEDKPKEEEF